jgi:hypothetical protein
VTRRHDRDLVATQLLVLLRGRLAAGVAVHRRPVRARRWWRAAWKLAGGGASPTHDTRRLLARSVRPQWCSGSSSRTRMERSWRHDRCGAGTGLRTIARRTVPRPTGSAATRW